MEFKTQEAPESYHVYILRRLKTDLHFRRWPEAASLEAHREALQRSQRVTTQRCLGCEPATALAAVWRDATSDCGQQHKIWH